MERPYHAIIWPLGKHAVALWGKGWNKLQMRTGRSDAPAARIILVSIIYVYANSQVLDFATGRRAIDIHDVCGGDLINLQSKPNHYASSVFLAKSWFKPLLLRARSCCLCFERRIVLRLYLTKDLICRSKFSAESC